MDTRILICICALSIVTSAGAPFSNGESYLVLTKQTGPRNQLDKQLKTAGAFSVQDHPEIGLIVAQSNKPNFTARAKRLADVRSVIPDVMVQWIEPDASLYAKTYDVSAAALTEPLSFMQWGLNAISVQAAWQKGIVGAGVVVAVLDTGINYRHPDLAPNYVGGYDFVNLDNDPMDDEFHGTHVSGIVAAADNSIGVLGVAPSAKLMGVKVLNRFGRGSIGWIVAGILYAVNNGADVINMSFSSAFHRNGMPDQNLGANDVAEIAFLWNRVTTYAHRQNVLLVASAGNDNLNRNHDGNLLVLPADAPHVIAVSATGPLNWFEDESTDLDVPAYYTNYGQSAIDFAAPGGNVNWNIYPNGPWYYDMVFSTFPTGWGWMSGTSMAAPHVSGVAALLIGYHNFTLSPSQVESILRQSSDDLGKPGKDEWFGYGRVNAGKMFD